MRVTHPDEAACLTEKQEFQKFLQCQDLRLDLSFDEGKLFKQKQKGKPVMVGKKRLSSHFAPAFHCASF